uniref:hypothetical protein n=1 Tax=Bacillus altitudinis TaxID=293387 RepID=UPI001C92CE9D
PPTQNPPPAKQITPLFSIQKLPIPPHNPHTPILTLSTFSPKPSPTPHTKNPSNQTNTHHPNLQHLSFLLQNPPPL